MVLAGCGTIQQVPCHQNLKIGAAIQNNSIFSFNENNGNKETIKPLSNSDNKEQIEQNLNVDRAQELVGLKAINVVAKSKSMDTVMPNPQMNVQTEIARQKKVWKNSEFAFLSSLLGTAMPIPFVFVTCYFIINTFRLRKHGDPGKKMLNWSIGLTIFMLVFLILVMAKGLLF